MRAAVVIVLPTPVSVPVTRMMPGRFMEVPPKWCAAPRVLCSMSAGVRVARAVSRSREIPSGTDGGRKQPMRTPAARAARVAARAAPADGMVMDWTAPAAGSRRIARAVKGRREPGGQGRRVAPDGAGAPGLVPDDPHRGEGGRRGGRGQAGVEDEAAGPVDEVFAQQGGSQDGSALATPGPWTGWPSRHVRMPGKGCPGHRAAALKGTGAGDAEAVGLVDEQHGVMLPRPGPAGR